MVKQLSIEIFGDSMNWEFGYPPPQRYGSWPVRYHAPFVHPDCVMLDFGTNDIRADGTQIIGRGFEAAAPVDLIARVVERAIPAIEPCSVTARNDWLLP